MTRWWPLLLSLLYCPGVVASDTLEHSYNIDRVTLARSALQRLAGVAGYTAITNPVAIGISGNMIYMVDADRKLIYRYSRSSETLDAIEMASPLLHGVPSAIMVDHDGSYYVADALGRQVLHFSLQGELLHRYQDLANLSMPVSIALAEGGNLLIADRLFNHVVVFNRQGQALRAIGQRGTGKGQLMELVDMARGPDGIYLLDLLNPHVLVFSEAGALLYEIPRVEVVDPSAIAVDAMGRVYVSDGFDDTIKVFHRHGLLEVLGGTGSQAGQFRMVQDMQVANNFLYVADSVNNRVQVFLIKRAGVDN